MSFHVVASDSVSEEAMDGVQVTSRRRSPFRRWPRGRLHALADGSQVTACGAPIDDLVQFRERSWPPRGISPDSSVCPACVVAAVTV